MELRVSSDPSNEAATWIARRLADACRRRGTASLALSGGSTAPSMIDDLVGRELPWESVTVWQVDERIAPDGHEARNANQLAAFSGRPCQVIPMPVTHASPRAAARMYAVTLPDQIDVVHLGVGDDGHTASWPPGVDAVPESSRAVEFVDTFNGWERLTLTRRVVNGARSRVVLATGASKQPVIERWMAGDRAIPITSVAKTNTWVFLDEAAAPSAALH